MGKFLEQIRCATLRILLPEVKNYLVTEFNFNREWDQYKKVAVFTNNNTEYPVLIENNKCVIDSDALTSGWFYVYVIGQVENERMNTNSVMVRQVLR